MLDQFVVCFSSSRRACLYDQAIGFTQEGLDMLEACAQRNGFTQILDPSDGLDQRMAIYQQAAAGSPVKAYINVGGGIASVGSIAH